MAGIIIQVIPAKVGIKVLKMVIKKLDTRLRWYDNIFYMSVNLAERILPLPWWERAGERGNRFSSERQLGVPRSELFSTFEQGVS